ncbi:MAG: hypothetical protein JWM31_3545 [Solirubrobacterales bacterium]|nr:hypothetical protein [Solirubrobacterales bacterium]
MADPFDLDRFLHAQDRDGVYDEALAELRAGRKRTHWVWFVFPQLAGLGRSPVARHYAIGSLAEAQAYLEHPVLGARLREATAALLEHTGRDPEDVLGGIDALKVRSCATLFAAAAGDEAAGDEAAAAPFVAVLDGFFGGERDARTLALL